MLSNCQICVGHPRNSWDHISSHIHRSNLLRLPVHFWLMDDKDIYKHIHSRRHDTDLINQNKKNVK